MEAHGTTPAIAPFGTISGLRWLMATAAVVPILMFVALAWYDYGRTVDQARQALLHTSRIVHEHAAQIRRIDEARIDAGESQKGDTAASSYEYLSRFYRDVAAPHPGLTIALLRSDGEVIASYPEREDSARGYDPDGPVMKAIRERSPQGIVDGPSTLENAYRLAAFRQVEPFPIYVVVSRTSRSVFEEWRHDVQTLAVFVAPTWLALMLAVWLAFKRARSEHDAVVQWHEETIRRTRAEDQLRQFQKYEALGELTGGVAHDFNNLLHIVSTNVAIMSLLPRGADLRPHLSTITRAVTSGNALTKHLLAFARKQPLTCVRIAIRETLPFICNLARHSLPKTIELRCEVDAEVRDIMADSAELELAIINLSVNARDAMPDGGVITVRARNAPANGAEKEEVPDSRRDYVAISVSDTGSGIPASALDRIFEPFFTTKKDKGTGLGLSRVYGYVRQLGGNVTATNAAGGGAVITLYIPVSERLAADPSALEIRIAGVKSDGARV